MTTARGTAAEATERFEAARVRARAQFAWLGERRDRAWERFGELGVPTTRDEDWKYTDVTRAAARDYATAGEITTAESAVERWFLPEAAESRLVFVEGVFAPSLSRVGALLGAGVVVGDLGRLGEDDLAGARELFETLGASERSGLAALNAALTAGGALVVLPAGRAVESTIQIMYVSGASPETMSHPRTLVVAGEGSVARVVEQFVSLDAGDYAFTNAAAEIFVGANATVEHYRIQNEADDATHVGSTDVRVARSGSYTSIAVALGAALARHDLRVALVEEHASCRIDGLYATDGARHTDSHTVVDHAVPNCESSQLYKGVLDDKSRAVFNGKVLVRRDAQRTAARQTNRNLLLSATARVDTKPELEIYADDVTCTHGATVGALDDDERFYLASRGLADEDARGLLTYGFAEEIVGEIKTETLRRQLDAVLLSRFRRAGANW